MSEDSRKEGQNKERCTIVGCSNTGRKFGSIGDIEIFYCPKHRKLGEKIMNHLFDDKRDYLRSELLYKSKHSLMFEGEPKLCEECNKKILDFLTKAITEIDKDNEFLEYSQEEVQNAEQQLS